MSSKESMKKNRYPYSPAAIPARDSPAFLRIYGRRPSAPSFSMNSREYERCIEYNMRFANFVAILPERVITYGFARRSRIG